MYAGIDLGGTNIAAGLVDSNGNIIIKDSTPARAERQPDEIITDMAGLVRKMAEKSGISYSDIEWVGVGSPGLVDSERGIVLHASNLKFSNLPMGEMISRLTGIPSYLENDANCAAYAESLFGASKGAENSLMVTLGTGIGGGIIAHRKIYTGHDFGAGEIGHMVISAGGRPCGCGRKGCFEAYSSATGLINMTKEKIEKEPKSLLAALGKEKIDGRTAFRAAREGDKAAKEVIDEYIYYLAVGIGNIIRILYPDILVIGGGISQEGDGLFVPLRKAVMHELAFCVETDILKAKLGSDAGIVGAAMLGNTGQRRF